MTRDSDLHPASSSKAGPREHAPPIVRDLVRDEVVRAPTWVVKVGTSVLTAPDGTLDLARIGHLAEQICSVMEQGRKVALRQLGGSRRRHGSARLEAPA